MQPKSHPILWPNARAFKLRPTGPRSCSHCSVRLLEMHGVATGYRTIDHAFSTLGSIVVTPPDGLRCVRDSFGAPTASRLPYHHAIQGLPSPPRGAYQAPRGHLLRRLRSREAAGDRAHRSLTRHLFMLDVRQPPSIPQRGNPPGTSRSAFLADRRQPLPQGRGAATSREALTPGAR